MSELLFALLSISIVCLVINIINSVLVIALHDTAIYTLHVFAAETLQLIESTMANLKV